MQRQEKTASGCVLVALKQLKEIIWFCLKAKVSAVGNLHIFSWWEGDIL